MLEIEQNTNIVACARPPSRRRRMGGAPQPAPEPSPTAAPEPVSGPSPQPVPEPSPAHAATLDALVLDDQLRALAFYVGRNADQALAAFRVEVMARGRTCADYRAAFRVWLRKPQRTTSTAAQRAGGEIRPPSPWPQRLDGRRQRGFWSTQWGPKPGAPGCRAPRAILYAHGYDQPAHGAGAGRRR